MRRLLCALLLCVPVGVAPAAAQRLPAAQPLSTWGPNGFVSAVTRAGDRLVLGGSFYYVGPPSGGLALVDANAGQTIDAVPPLPGPASLVAADGAGGWFVVTRTNVSNLTRVLHLDAAGAPLPGWSEPAIGMSAFPTNVAAVYAIAVDGPRLFLGGFFDSVNGTTRRAVAALDVTTGALLPWNATLAPNSGVSDPQVSQLVVDNGVVVIAGYFASVGGVPRANLAGLDSATGALTTLAPSTCLPGDVSLSLVAGGGRVYRVCSGFASLHFEGLQLDGTPLPAWAPPSGVFELHVATPQAVYATDVTGQLVALDPMTGAASPVFTPGMRFIRRAAFAAGRLFVAGFDNSSLTGRTDALDPVTGAIVWSRAADTIECLASDGVQVAVCAASVGGVAAKGLATIDLRTGRAVPVPDFGQTSVSALHAIGDVVVAAVTTTSSFTLRAFSASTGVVVPWSLTINSTVYTLASTTRTLFAGGAFTAADGQPRRGLLAIDLASGTLAPPSQGILGQVTALGTAQGRLFAFGTDAAGGPGSPTVSFDAATLQPLPFAPSPPPGNVRGFGFAPGRVLTAGGVNAPRVAAEWFALDGGAPIDVGNTGLLDFDAWSVSQSGSRIAMVGRRGGSVGLAAIVDARTGRARPWDAVGDSAPFLSTVLASPDLVAVTGSFYRVRSVPAFNLAVFPMPPLTAPTALTGAVSGFAASVQWTPPASGASTYVVEAGSAPGASDIAVIDAGAATSLGGTLPPGRYYVRVRSVDDAETSPPSNEVVLQVPAGIALPGAPGTLSASVANRVVSLAWGTASGAASYVIEAGSVSGASDLGAFPLAGTGTTFSAPVPPGTYFVRLRGANAAGTGAPSNEVTVVVP